MSHNHQEMINRLRTAVFESRGVTDRSLRRAVQAAAAPGSHRLEAVDSSIPAALRAYINKVGRCAYKVTDRDIESLKAHGYSEEAIFELTVSAAVGAGFGRLQRGLAALNGGPTAPGGGE